MADRDRLIASALEGYEPEIGAALWRLEDGRERTLRALAGAPADALDSGADGNSIGTILYHLALIEADWLYTEILERPLPDEAKPLFPVEDRDEQGVLLTVRGERLDDHLARLATVRGYVLEALRPMDADEFHRVRSLDPYDVTPAWVLHHLTQHEAEHRGEILSVIDRLTRSP